MAEILSPPDIELQPQKADSDGASLPESNDQLPAAGEHSIVEIDNKADEHQDEKPRERRAAEGVTHHTPTGQSSTYLAFLALGVIYGDIGTSPLYVMQAIFSTANPHKSDEILGAVSMIIWSLVVVVSGKYVFFLLQADAAGEGGIFAQLSLLGSSPKPPRLFGLYIVLAMVGVGLALGDGVITPAISVLSAIEGLKVAADGLDNAIVPISLVILIALFLLQSQGTSRIGQAFSPIMVLWFLALGVAGITQLAQEPSIFRAFGPNYAVNFFVNHTALAWNVAGLVVLSITGCEAMYADLGHFGRRAVRLGWFGFVMPCLLLNYLGQGALLLRNPSAADNPFYRSFHSKLFWPVLVLSTAATVIASQAMITGSFSIVTQAVRQNYLPHLQVAHTSKTLHGQIYVPAVNFFLMVLVVAIVLGFRSSSNLTHAYGLAVTLDGLLQTIFFCSVMHYKWNIRPARIIAFGVVYLAFDILYISSTLRKVADGGWLPLVIGFIISCIMVIWWYGNSLYQGTMVVMFSGHRFDFWSLLKRSPSLENQSDVQKKDELVRSISRNEILGITARQTSAGSIGRPVSDIVFMPNIKVSRYPGIGIFLSRHHTSSGGRPPIALTALVEKMPVLPEHIIMLTFDYVLMPRVPEDERFSLHDLDNNVKSLVVNVGFAETPDMYPIFCLAFPQLFVPQHMTSRGARVRWQTRSHRPVTFFSHRSRITYKSNSSLRHKVLVTLFGIMHLNQTSMDVQFSLPVSRLVEVGFSVAM